MRVCQCRGNRLVDFVRDRGRHLAQQHDPIEAREIGLGLLQSRLGAFAIGDVDDNCTTEGRRAVCRGNDKRSGVGPYDLAVLASVTLALQNPDSTAINPLLHCSPIVLVSNLQGREISQLFFGIAGHPLETLVRRQIPSALKINRRNADRSGLEHRSPALFGRAQRRLGPLAISDVPADAAVADEAPRLVKYRQPRHGDVALSAVGRRPRVLEITERQVGVERLAVLAPGLGVRLQVGHFPARLTDLGAWRRCVSNAFCELLANEPMLRVALPVHVERELHQGAKTLLSFPQRRFGLFAFRDVYRHHGKKCRRVFCRGYGRRADVRPYDRTVLASIALFEAIGGLLTRNDAGEKPSRLCPIVLVCKFECA